MKLKFWTILTFTTILVVSLAYFLFPTEKQEEIVPEKLEQVEVLPTLFYGLTVDSFEIASGKIRWNQNLSEILSDYNISYQDLHELSIASREVYDVRKLKAGAEYHIIHQADSMSTARKFIFEPSATEYVVYHLDDSIYASLHEKPIERIIRSIAVEINSSMYEALLEQESSPLLVNQLVDVFAWQVDFFRIAKGDKLKVIYEEEIVDDKIVGIGEIKAAFFEHWGKEYYAIPYTINDKQEYFDEKGNSLRKTFLRAPLSYRRISSRFSLRRFHPVQKRYKAHLGTDYAAAEGTPIRTVGDGVVLEARYHGGNGNYVKIRHNSNYTTQYLHMSKIAKGIRPGVKVKQGMTIGYVGSTGLANGPHLCFRFWKNGRQVDALKVDLPSSAGIPETEINQFLLSADKTKELLDSLPFPGPKPLLATIEYPLPLVD